MPMLPLGNKFKLFTKQHRGLCLIISAHASVVPQPTGMFSGIFGKKTNIPLQNAEAFWFLAPPNSSMEHEPYEQMMARGMKLLPNLQLAKPQGEYHGAEMIQQSRNLNPPKMIQNMILTHYDEPGQQEKESILIRRAVENQNFGIWDIMTVNKKAGEVTLEDALKALNEVCSFSPYEMIMGHFCNVREGERDNFGIYNAGYSLFQDKN